MQLALDAAQVQDARTTGGLVEGGKAVRSADGRNAVAHMDCGCDCNGSGHAATQ